MYNAWVRGLSVGESIMATVTPVSFGLTIPKYTPQNSKQQNTNTQFAAASKYSSGDVVPNQKSALAVLLTSAMLCTVAIVNLIKAGR